ncbi:hypothetical protein TVAG_437300 [Trichomonas vaginalis G3]|uniref:Sister chromatid cohesion protein n=1 Tax=Trichomonas vaginalis (strain ATCC PRA-98 / G3) TaxID=412133 RepID=A2DFH6_TRIV3|nr:Scc2/Nipped-B family [Trichomonas vaginalis G3]EAY20904.1 hypothetical protein TVAG_437300 [Trichomonas vaginalis G3]KAI5521485.1 Scc2/Nipped-B family [Trichomonas vaginalis G3]|eukprot:XP_001581890.1 hypothetical protein [Trichomonas vaginalis G3]
MFCSANDSRVTNLKLSADLPKVENETNLVSPAGRCTEILKQYCELETLTTSMVREISTHVNELYRIKQLSEVNLEFISKFIQNQSNFIKQSEEFQFDIIEICLTFYASNDMPPQLYKESQMNIILRSIFKFCSDNFIKTQENNLSLHKMFPIIRLCAKLIDRCALPDSFLSSFVSIAIEFYFNEASSNPLQTASCSLISSIFRRYELERTQILNDIFYCIERKTGNQKSLIFNKTDRVRLNAFSVLLFDIIQSCSIYPNTIDCCNIDIIQDIINRLEELPPKYTEMFANDVFSCLSHPLYPSSISVLPYLLNMMYKHITKKTKLTRVAINSFCKGLSSVLAFREKFLVPMTIKINYNIMRILQINDLSEINVTDKYPENEKERLIAEFVVLTFVKNFFKLIDTFDTASICNISHWSSLKNMDQTESDYLDQWWHNQIPEVSDFSLNFSEVERLYVSLCQRFLIFNSVMEIIHRLLKGLTNTSSTMRGMVLKGFSSIVEMNSQFLYHPDLIPLIEKAFVDPCSSIRDAVLDIVSSYIEKNEQIKSPYFPLIIDSLKDSSPSIVRKSLVTLGNLAQKATEEELMKLSKILVSKLDDETKAVKTAAKSLLVTSLFEISFSPFVIFYEISKNIDIENDKWWTVFVKECYVKFPEKMKAVVDQVIEKVTEETNDLNSMILYNFVSVLPNCSADKHEQIITAILTAETDISVTFLMDSLLSIIPFILFPSIVNFSLLLSHLESLVCTRWTTVVRKCLELIVSIVHNICPDDNILETLQSSYADILLLSFGGKKIEENEVLRAIFVTGVLFKLIGWITPKGNINKVASILGRFYMSDSRLIRKRVLQSFVDICCRDSSQLRVSRNLVQMAFKRGDDEDALDFILKLMVEENKMDVKIEKFDEMKGNSAAPLISQFIKNITNCFKSQNKTVRTDSLKLVSIGLSNGLINAHEVLPFVIACLSSTECYKSAIETIKKCQESSFEGALKTRISDGIDQSYEFIVAFSEDKSIRRLGFTDLFTLTKNPLLRKDIMTNLVSKVYAQMDVKSDMNKCLWLCDILVNLNYEYQWEAYYVCQLLQKTVCKNSHNVLIDAGDMIEILVGTKQEKEAMSCTACWYSCLIGVMTSHWLRRRYQVNPKKLYNNEKPREDKRNVKVALIPPLNLNEIKKPQEKLEKLTPEILDIVAKLQSVVRHERATEDKAKPSVPNNTKK